MSDRILVADDEPSVRDAVGYALRQEGFEVTVAVDGEVCNRGSQSRTVLRDGAQVEILTAVQGG